MLCIQSVSFIYNWFLKCSIASTASNQQPDVLNFSFFLFFLRTCMWWGSTFMDMFCTLNQKEQISTRWTLIYIINNPPILVLLLGIWTDAVASLCAALKVLHPSGRREQGLGVSLLRKKMVGALSWRNRERKWQTPASFTVSNVNMLLAPSPCLLLLCDGFCDVFSGLPPAMLNCSYSPPSGGKLKVWFSINADQMCRYSPA